LIKAIVTALVLIVGAAVVLWYGNTLNSWVLGGLIGGFGAVLLSIPISLVLFSYFSQHYAQHQQKEVLEHNQIALARRGSYSIVQDQSSYDDEDYLNDQDQEFELDEYMLAEQIYWEDEAPHRISSTRHLPVSSSARLSTVNQDLCLQGQRNSDDADLERQSLWRKESASRPVKFPGSPSYQVGPSYSQYRSEALRAARMEAALQSDHEEASVFPMTRPKRQEQMQQRKSRRLQSSHDVGQSSTNDYAQRPRRIVDSLPRR
jgi:hypothetical protein